MTWLDVEPNGPCPTYNNSAASITFSNIKFGTIGSTVQNPIILTVNVCKNVFLDINRITAMPRAYYIQLFADLINVYLK